MQNTKIISATVIFKHFTGKCFSFRKSGAIENIEKADDAKIIKYVKDNFLHILTLQYVWASLGNPALPGN